MDGSSVRRGALILALLLVSSPALAQTAPVAVTASSGFALTPSNQHGELYIDGTPVIIGYEYFFASEQVGCPLPTPDALGKPDPVNGLITVKPFAPFGTIQGNCLYTLLVRAVGQQQVVSTEVVGQPPFVRKQVYLQLAPPGSVRILP